MKIMVLLMAIFLGSSAFARPTKVIFDHGHTAKKKERFIYNLKTNSQMRLDVWKSDEVECSFRSYGGDDDKGSLDCWMAGFRTQIGIDCERMMGKDKKFEYFVGGFEKVNQNFEIWCE